MKLLFISVYICVPTIWHREIFDQLLTNEIIQKLFSSVFLQRKKYEKVFYIMREILILYASSRLVW